MRKRATLTFFILISSFGSLFATHIVGGEFELVHLYDFNYRLNLILYFDNIYGNPGAEDEYAEVYIFRKSDGQTIQTIVLPQVEDDFVDYSIVECTSDALETRRLFYSREIYLAPGVFDDPDGYYVVWERCCRNRVINNILAPDAEGQTFLLHFPPVVKDGEPFVNSSPILFPPLRDYACVNQFYFAEFAGEDPDGDSLAYSLTTPLSTSTIGGGSIALPIPTPPPYPLVTWVPGISLENVVPGKPSLSVDKYGLVTVTPSTTGLFVFSVLVEEYRDGIKIGDVRRDFQMLVIECPPPGVPPKLVVKPPGSTIFTENPPLFTFAADDEKCLQFAVTDADHPTDGTEETIRFRVKPVNFNGNVDDILSIKKGSLGTSDSLFLDLCFPDCPFLDGIPFIIDVIAFDNTCPQGLRDTVRIAALVKAPINNDPYFTNTEKNIIKIFTEGDNYQLAIEGIDPDKDSLQISILTDEFDPVDFGMDFGEFIFDKDAGTLNTEFTWETGCDIYNFTEKTNFILTLLLEDYDQCLFGNPDTIRMNLTVLLPPNTDPVISTDLPDLDMQLEMGTQLNFTVFGDDTDGDVVVLKGKGVGFDFANYDITFSGDSSVSHVENYFYWNIDCVDKYLVNNEFEMLFWVEDRDKCKFPNQDSLSVRVTVVPPPNEKPIMNFTNLNNELIVTGDTIEAEIGQTISLSILGNDVDADLMNMELYNSPKGVSGYTFNNTFGIGSVSSDFTWSPGCENLADEFSPAEYVFKFLVKEDRCVLSDGDSLEITVKIKDLGVTHDIFIPPNVFTPNGDGKNDFFELASLDIPEGQRLPEDNCVIQFKSITIYNRWGKEVFSDFNRAFKWSGGDNPAGVYYYYLEFTHTTYKGTLSIIN